jgi:hypothetical protein
MGIIRLTFSFMMGTLCGAYVAQNYKVPYIKRLPIQALSWASWPSTWKKPIASPRAKEKTRTILNDSILIIF